MSAPAQHSHGKIYRFGWFAAGLVIGLLMGWMASALHYSGFFASEEEAPDTDYSAEYVEETAEEAGEPVTEVIEAPAKAEPAAAPPAMRLDTVSATRYITHMAAEYYGNRVFWVYIYEANRDHLGHPERTLPGTVVSIPEPSAIPVNAHSADDLKAARKLAAEIYARFQ